MSSSSSSSSPPSSSSARAKELLESARYVAPDGRIMTWHGLFPQLRAGVARAPVLLYFGANGDGGRDDGLPFQVSSIRMVEEEDMAALVAMSEADADGAKLYGGFDETLAPVRRAVFISLDASDEDFRASVAGHAWYSLDHADRKTATKLATLFGVTEARIVTLDGATLETINPDAAADLCADASRLERFPWPPPPCCVR